MKKTELKRKTVSIALIVLVNNAHSLIRDESAAGALINTQNKKFRR